ncbi:MAG: TRAP transporter permease [Oscillibacter sp.]|nr:TRAP transporter permease [Oscillibacter sp.]
MAFLKKKKPLAEETVGVASVDTAEVGTAADVEEVMKKYDRESNTRIWTGMPKMVIRYLMAAFSVYCLAMTLLFRGIAEIPLTLFLGFIIIIGYLNYPASKKNVKENHLPWYDVVIMIVGSVPFFYFAANAEKILLTDYTVISKSPIMLAMAVVAILALMELCRRSVGIPILCVVAALLIYALVNVRFGKVMYDLFYTVSGVMGTPIATCQKYIVIFIIFGAFLERTGISNFFINLANCVAGASAGGPAKVAVISSALCGMVSGSSVGNTVTTGSVTIPMMKRTGYKGEFAGAVEAAASTGGQIMPPIMGAAAFLMAEYTGIPYAKIALLAVLPAVLYFTGIYIAVHLEAKKLGLRGLNRDELPRFRELAKKIYLLAPLVILVWLVSTGARTMQSSAAIAILVTIIVGIINKDDRISLSKAVDALEAGGKGTITVAAACAMAGVVAGCIVTTGLASKLLRAIVAASAGVPILALFLTMICCIILGMGVPTTANYCIMASTCAPILMSEEIGIPMLAAHFFVFYFGIVADITPPVALAAYAGSAIAKAPPMKTALNATKLAIAAFIVPYIFALNPAMLFMNKAGDLFSVGALDVVLIVVSALIGLFGIAAALNGHLYRKINPAFRVLLIAGGLGMMIPGAVSDAIGLVVVGGIVLLQYLAAKKEGLL